MALVASSVWHKVAALSGFSAVALAAYGAHGHKPADPHFALVFQRANQQQFYHTMLLAVAPFARRPNIVGALATAGLVLFSGSCYACALKQDRSLGKLAPLGGFAFMGAWLALAL